jgi:hypothetical protein
VRKYFCFILGHKWMKEFVIDATKDPMVKRLLFVECEHCGRLK